MRGCWVTTNLFQKPSLVLGEGIEQDPSFKSSIAYTHLTAAEARLQLQAQGFSDELLPAPSTMAVVLNRLGYRLRSVVKARAQKNSPKLT